MQEGQIEGNPQGQQVHEAVGQHHQEYQRRPHLHGQAEAEKQEHTFKKHQKAQKSQHLLRKRKLGDSRRNNNNDKTKQIQKGKNLGESGPHKDTKLDPSEVLARALRAEPMDLHLVKHREQLII